MTVPSFQALVYHDNEFGLCITFQDNVKDEVTDERFAAFARACAGEPVRKVDDSFGLRIEGYKCADPTEPYCCLESMWVLADLSHKHFGVETNVAAPRPH